MRITIDVYSDPVCPWCFIGKRRLGRALAERADIEAVVHWRAFQLNPAMPESGMERHAYLVSKFGSAEEAHRLYDHIAAVGLREKIDFNFEAIARTPNTVRAHTLIRYGAEHGKCDAVADALFRAFFLDARDIGGLEQLALIAETCALDANAFIRFYEEGRAANEVQSEDLLGRRIGIDGVPYFIIDGKYALSGAQEPEAFHNIFDVVLETDRDAQRRRPAEVSPAAP